MVQQSTQTQQYQALYLFGEAACAVLLLLSSGCMSISIVVAEKRLLAAKTAQ
jgi:hypothetical protein